MTTILQKDIFSHFKSKDKKDFIQYGSKGQKVTVISDCGNVLIVEDKTGFRFPVKKSDVLYSGA